MPFDGSIYIRHLEPESDVKRIYFVDPGNPSSMAYTISSIGAVMARSSFTNREVMDRADCEKVHLDQRALLDVILDVYS